MIFILFYQVNLSVGRSELVMSLCQSDIAYDAPEWLTGEHMTGMYIIDEFDFVQVRIRYMHCT